MPRYQFKRTIGQFNFKDKFVLFDNCAGKLLLKAMLSRLLLCLACAAAKGKGKVYPGRLNGAAMVI